MSEEDRLLIRQSLADLPHLWQAETTTPADRKRLLRCLIREVAVDGLSEPGRIVIRVCWQTGATTPVSVRRPRSTDGLATATGILEQIRQLAPDHSDDQIAEALNTQQLTTRWGKPWTYLRVHNLRVRHHIPSGCPVVPRSDAARGDGLVSVRTAARSFQVSKATIGGWIRHGVLWAQHAPGRNPYWVRVSPEDIARLTADAPEPGYASLPVAVQTLGLTEVQLWAEVQAGQRTIRRLRRGQRWEWQIELPSRNVPSGQ